MSVLISSDSQFKTNVQLIPGDTIEFTSIGFLKHIRIYENQKVLEINLNETLTYLPDIIIDAGSINNSPRISKIKRPDYYFKVKSAIEIATTVKTNLRGSNASYLK